MQKANRRVGLGATILTSLSIFGAVTMNDFWLNPTSTLLFNGATAFSGTSNSNFTSTNGEPSATGEPISYRYGTVQLQIKYSASKLSDISTVQASATDGREAVFPTLVQMALEANGTNFGNISGATFPVDAFRQALESAINKP